MAGYEDTRQKIISTLMGRPVGTEIQPENHQDYALNMLDYIRSLELIATSTLIGVAESNTTPVQPNSSRVCYIAGVAQNQTVTFENFIGENGNPISVTTGDMEGVFIILMWNTQYWSAQTFSTNIISQSESATFYYRFNIRKTYESVALMNADVENPIGTDGKYIKVGDIVTVVNSTTPSENGIYSYEGATNGWKYQSSFNFQVEQVRSQNTNTAPSSKLFDDNIDNLSGEIGSESLARTAGDNALQASIDNLSGEIGSESLARTAGDNALQASINQEILDRQNEIQGLTQTVNSNTEEIQNEITNRTQTVNALRNELLNKSIGSIATGAEEKPAEGVSRRYRFTDDGNCYFTDVLNGLTFDVMPVPFQVSKDDELSVTIFDGDYTYIYFPTMTELKNSIGTAMGDISSALDEILLIGGSI